MGQQRSCVFLPKLSVIFHHHGSGCKAEVNIRSNLGMNKETLSCINKIVN